MQVLYNILHRNRGLYTPPHIPVGLQMDSSGLQVDFCCSSTIFSNFFFGGYPAKFQPRVHLDSRPTIWPAWTPSHYTVNQPDSISETNDKGNEHDKDEEPKEDQQPENEDTQQDEDSNEHDGQHDGQHDEQHDEQHGKQATNTGSATCPHTKHAHISTNIVTTNRATRQQALPANASTNTPSTNIATRQHDARTNTANTTLRQHVVPANINTSTTATCQHATPSTHTVMGKPNANIDSQINAGVSMLHASTQSGWWIPHHHPDCAQHRDGR